MPAILQAISELTVSKSTTEYKKAVLKKEQLYSKVKRDFDQELQLNNTLFSIDNKSYELRLKTRQAAEEVMLPLHDRALIELPAFLQGMTVTHYPKLYRHFFSKSTLLNQNLNITLPFTLPKTLVSQIEVLHIRKEMPDNVAALKDSYVLIEGTQLLYIDKQGKSNEVKMDKEEAYALSQILVDHPEDLKGVDQDLLSEHFTVLQMEELNNWMSQKICRPLFQEIPDIVQAISFSGGYEISDLVTIFSELAKRLEPLQLKMPVNFLESSINHTILTVWQNNWLHVDANQLPPKEFKKSQDIADTVLKGLSKNDYTTFATFIYTHVSQADIVKDCVQQCMAETQWQKIHKLTAEKINKRDSYGASWLHIIAETNNVDCLNDISRIPSIDYNMKTTLGITPLILAAERGFYPIVQLLHDLKVDVNVTNEAGVTPLYIASQNGLDTVVEQLLAMKADVNVITKKGETPLYIASENGLETIVRLLIDAKSNVNAVTTKGAGAEGVTPLYIASQNGFYSIVQQLFDAKGDVNIGTKAGATPLYIAAQEGFDTLVQLLLDMKSDPNVADLDGITPVYIASQNGFTTTLQLLLDRKGDVNRATINGITSTYIAAQNGLNTILELLYKMKANVNTPIKQGVTPLSIAILKGLDVTVELLLDMKGDVNAEDKGGFTPLFRAVEENANTIVGLLVDRRANVNAAIKNGITPLYLAAQNGSIRIVELLLNSPEIRVESPIKASIPILIREAKKQSRLPELQLLLKDKKIMGDELHGFTPLNAAAFFGHMNTVALMLNTIDPNEDKNISTLDFARAMGHQSIVTLLIPYYTAREAKDYPGMYSGLIRKIRESKQDTDGTNVFYEDYGEILEICANLNKALKHLDPKNNPLKKAMMLKVQGAIKNAYQGCISGDEIQPILKELSSTITEVIVTAEQHHLNTFMGKIFHKNAFSDSLKKALTQEHDPSKILGKNSPT